MQYYIDCLMKYATFGGRARRQEFWMFFLVDELLVLVLHAVGAVLGTFILGALYNLAVLVPRLAVGARRLHDMGRTGWWQLLLLIPFVGFILLIGFWCLEGERFENEYGAVPKGR